MRVIRCVRRQSCVEPLCAPPRKHTPSLRRSTRSLLSFRLDCTTHLCISFNKKEICDFSYAKIVKH